MPKDPKFYLKEVPTYQELKDASLRCPLIDPSACEVYLQLLRAGQGVRAHLEQFLSRYGMSHSRFMLLSLLKHAPDRQLPVCELARLAGVSAPTVTSVLGGMVREGLVSRLRGAQDRRAVLIRMEPKGMEQLKLILPELFRRQSQAVADLTEDERRELSRLLAKVQPERLSQD